MFRRGTRPGRNITRFRRHAKALYLKVKYFFPTYVNFHYLCLRSIQDILFYFVVHLGGYHPLQSITILVIVQFYNMSVKLFPMCIFVNTNPLQNA